MTRSALLFLAALACLGQIRARAAPPGEILPPVVVVIGGGVAGLTAAATLHHTGRFNVTLLEAADRIGGRTYTLRFNNTNPSRHIEIGAEWVHGEKDNPVFELVNPLGLVQTEADPPLRQYQFPFQHGGAVDDSVGTKLEQLYEDVLEDPEGWGDDVTHLSLGEYARVILEEFNKHYDLGWDAAFQEVVLDWLHRRLLEEEAADNWFESSASDEGDQYDVLEGRENVTWKPPYGYSSLHQLLLTGHVTDDGLFDLPDWIRLNQEVTVVDYSNNAFVRVCTRDGTCYQADHVVFTPSLGVLKATHAAMFSPALPDKHQLTIEHFGFGNAAKYFLEFSEPWWPADYNGANLLWDDITYDYSDPAWQYWRSNITLEELMVDLNGLPLWTRAIARIFTVDSRSHPNMLRAWLTGPASKFLDIMDPDHVRTTMVEVIRRFLGPLAPGGQVPTPIAVYTSRWWSNPFTRGTYSFRTLDSDRYDVWARDLAVPIVNAAGKPALCFAGEATHPTFYSAVHGAYASGLREAERIEAWTNGGGRASASAMKGVDDGRWRHYIPRPGHGVYA